ncbi:Valine--tRNA ligase, mitochondrial 1 [Glycine soja]|uniref:valine--tRNA ligase n=1 Tax=Glycine soja TaxID=3848 RepID=A0A445HQQ3_GLYSO|nr:Valine--tRNA ligase, mitochondrial 1 [Glycine soja]
MVVWPRLDEWKAVPDIWRSSVEKYGDNVALVGPYHDPPTTMTEARLHGKTKADYVGNVPSYLEASVGPCNIPKPSTWELVEHNKWVRSCYSSLLAYPISIGAKSLWTCCSSSYRRGFTLDIVINIASILKNVLIGLYRGSENNEMRLGVCSRSNEVVEPMIKPQWYVNCNDLAKQALFVVVDEENKRIEIIPKQYLVD